MSALMAEIKLQELHTENLLAILDVLLDIQQESQLNPDRIAIPIMRQIIRFSQLMPADSIVEFGHLRPFSDIAGRHSVKMDGSTEKRQELAARLQKAGYAVKLTGTDWHRAGDLGSSSLRT
jgi:hypothetical protein